MANPVTQPHHIEPMRQALALAAAALEAGQFPVGCVIVSGGETLARAGRSGTACGDANETDHAEILALRRLDPRLPLEEKKEMTLYATMEPCLMCYAAILLTGIGRIVYAYEDIMGGGTACDLHALPPLYRERQIPIVPHILRRESIILFQRFFNSPHNAYWRGSPLAEYTLAQG